jgi:hypothetical protein
MKNRIALYMICAIAVGYLLVSAVPGQVALYTQPRMLATGSDGEEMLSGSPQPSEIPESGDSSDGNLTKSPEFNIEIEEDSRTIESQVDSRRALGDSLIGLSKWWIIDIFIALFIYYLARRFLV